MRNHRLILAATLITSASLLAPHAGVFPAAAQDEPLKIGIIGTGRIGGALARHWHAAGHEVFMSSRHPEELEPWRKSSGLGHMRGRRAKPLLSAMSYS